MKILLSDTNRTFSFFSAMQWIIYNGQEIISFYSPFFKWIFKCVSKIVQQTLWLLVSDRKFWQFSGNSYYTQFSVELFEIFQESQVTHFNIKRKSTRVKWHFWTNLTLLMNCKTGHQWPGILIETNSAFTRRHLTKISETLRKMTIYIMSM